MTAQETVAARLCAAGRDDVVLCVRTPFEALVVEGPAGLVRATPPLVTTPAAVQPVPWVVLAIKAHQTAGAADWLRALATSQTTVAILASPLDGWSSVRPQSSWCRRRWRANTSHSCSPGLISGSRSPRISSRLRAACGRRSDRTRSHRGMPCGRTCRGGSPPRGSR